MELTEIIPTTPTRLSCDTCGRHMILSYTDFDEIVSGIHIRVEALPTLICDCGAFKLPDRSRYAIQHIHQRSQAMGRHVFATVRQRPDVQFMRTAVPFLFHPDNYYYIAGLSRQVDDGFLTPVFFTKYALLRFQAHPDYRVIFASQSYGSIWRRNKHSIAFGVNRNRRLVMWLGDIASLPDDDQYALCADNVPSDHDVGSEFYDGQIEAIFTEPTAEANLIASRTRFIEAFLHGAGYSVEHLENETLDALTDIAKPIHFDDRETELVYSRLNKVVIESLNRDTLRRRIRDLNADGAIRSESGSLKLLELVIAQFQPEHARTLLCPFFVLYEMRIRHSHNISSGRKRELWESACDRMLLTRDVNMSDLYDAIVLGMTNSYERMAHLVS